MMKKWVGVLITLSCVPLFLTGCGTGEKGGSLAAVYGIMAVLALLLLVGYCLTKAKRDPWFFLLFVSILIVNCGYLALALSRNLEEALMANRMVYLGSVFLPLSMWMIIAGVSRIRYPKYLPGVLLGISVLMLLIAASPGYLTIYYKEVFFEKIRGVTILTKVYGPLHGLYPVYLLGYFVAMVATIIYATVRDKIESTSYAAILAAAVFVNIIVWGVEQMVEIEFEILSVSYIISECFLLGLRLLMLETEKQRNPVQISDALALEDPTADVSAECMELFVEGLCHLTPKEREIYDCYVAGMSTATIMENLNIKENTLKYHNKNIYSKLGVSSRKELMRLAALQQRRDTEKNR